MADIVEAIAASFVLHAAFFGFMHTFALALVLHAFDMRKVVGYDVIVDVFATIAFTMFYAGTYTGSTVGIFAGLFMSLYLRWYRRENGYKKLEREGRRLRWFFYHNNPAFAGDHDRVRCT